MRKATIAGTGMYAPDRVVKNSYFDELYQKDMDTFLREKRNIYERRFMAEDQSTSDLIMPAAEEALKNAGYHRPFLDRLYRQRRRRNPRRRTNLLRRGSQFPVEDRSSHSHRA